MRITEIVRVSHYDPNAQYLHGGPQKLEGERLKRYGKDGFDSGALFFCKDTPVGRWYAGTYGEHIWVCRLKPAVDQIFDFTNPQHAQRLQQNVSPQEFQSMSASTRSGHLDWTAIDDEMFGELGFRGVVFLERPKGMETGFPAGSRFSILPEDVLSVAIFHPEDVDVQGSMTRDELWKSLIG